MTQNNKTFATINVDAVIAAGVINPSVARKFAAKLAWYEEEVERLALHRNGQPSFKLAELEDDEMYVRYACDACKETLLDLNKAYHEHTGRYIVTGMIAGRDNLMQLLDEVVAM